jgi:hypothetical protein
MKPKPQYDEIHLEYYDMQEMDEYLKNLQQSLIDYLIKEIGKDSVVVEDVIKLICKFYKEEK